MRLNLFSRAKQKYAMYRVNYHSCDCKQGDGVFMRQTYLAIVYVSVAGVFSGALE